MMMIRYTGMYTETVVGMCEPLGVLVQLARATSPLRPQPKRSALWKLPFHSGFPPYDHGENSVKLAGIQIFAPQIRVQAKHF